MVRGKAVSTRFNVRPAKTQINLHIRAVWSESSLSVWIYLGSLASPQNIMRRLWSDCADAQADLSLRWTHVQSSKAYCAPARLYTCNFPTKTSCTPSVNNILKYPKISKYHTIETFCIFCTVTVPEWGCVTWSTAAVWFSLFSAISSSVSLLTVVTASVWLLSFSWSICSGVLLASDWSSVSNRSVVLLPEVAATYRTSTWSRFGVCRSRNLNLLPQ